jgi:hypothetical protein
MSHYSETDTYSQAGDWLMGRARRNPEALLLLAAGCCLLMRSGGNLSSRAASHSRPGEHSEGYQSEPRRAPSDIGRDSLNVRDGLSRGADSATNYASQIKDPVRIPQVLTPSPSPSSPRTRNAMCPSVRRA